MLLEIFIAIALGCLIGIFSGLCPGIHVNLVSAILISISPVLLSYTSPIVLAVFIISLAIIHTFLDTIPSIFLGAPDPDNVMAVLPGHKMLMEGMGFEAVRLMILGSFFGLLITLGLSPVLIPVLPFAYSLIQPLIGYLLVIVVLWMILMEHGIKKKFFAFYIFIVAGILGIIVFNLPQLNQPLFPMLTGLFGISTLLLSLNEESKVPEQDTSKTINIGKKNTIKAVFAGVFSGGLTGMLPGIGAAQASIIGMFIAGRKIGMYAFLILVGAVGTVNFAVSIATFYALEKARNGAIVAVMELMKNISYAEVSIFIFASLIAGCVGVILTLSIGKMFSKIISKVNYRMLAGWTIVLVSSLVCLISGWMGALVLAASTFLGLMPALIGVKRSHNMGCLMLPVIIYFLM
jgi:putative membrane protein